MRISSYRFTTKGKKKVSNLDFIHFQELKDGWLGIVCDGVGDGSENQNPAKLCSEKLVELFEQIPEKDPLEMLKVVIDETNKYFNNLNQNNAFEKKLASTLVILYLTNHSAYWGHIGDSRLYKLKNGRLNILTKDHSVIQQLIDKGFLTLKEALLHSGTNVIGRAIGEKVNVVVDVSKINLQPFDKNRFLLCTDGVTQILSDSEIEKCLQYFTVEECAECLKSLIDKYDVPDDASFIIVDAY